MKNKWYKVLSAGLLSVSAMYLCTALVVTGCSGDNGSVTGGDAGELSEVVESSSDEQIESSSSEVIESSSSEEVESSDVEENAKTEKSEKDEPSSSEETADAEEKSEQTESENPATSESEESAESGDVAAPEESAKPEETAEPEEPAKPNNAEPEEAEPSNEEQVEPSIPEQSELSCFDKLLWNEADAIEDTIVGYIDFESTIEDLKAYRYEFIKRWDEEVNDGRYLMDNNLFRAEYRTEEKLRKRLLDCGVVWAGGEWEHENYQKEDGKDVHIRCTAHLDTLLPTYVGNNNVAVHAPYGINCSIGDAPDITETKFLLDVLVQFNVERKPYNPPKKEDD